MKISEAKRRLKMAGFKLKRVACSSHAIYEDNFGSEFVIPTHSNGRDIPTDYSAKIRSLERKHEN